MKRIILLLLVAIFWLPTLAQQGSNLFEQLTDKYGDKEGFSASQISSEMFDLYLKKRNIDEESPVFEALKKLDNILVISQSDITGVPYRRGVYSSGTASGEKTDNNKTDEANEIHKEILNHYKSNNYTLFKTEKRMGEDVKVYLNKSNDKIVSLALITSSSVSTNLVELKGDIDLKTVSELNQALNLRGLENLYKIDNSSNSFFGYSVGRGAYSEERIEEMVARQRAMAEKQAELTEEQQAQFEDQARQMAEKQMQMAEKYREMAEKYQREPIFLSSPGDTNTVYYLDGKKVKAKDIKKIDKDKIESVKIEKDEKDQDKTTIRITSK
jgi:hypothetical protein